MFRICRHIYRHKAARIDLSRAIQSPRRATNILRVLRYLAIIETRIQRVPSAISRYYVHALPSWRFSDFHLSINSAPLNIGLLFGMGVRGCARHKFVHVNGAISARSYARGSVFYRRSSSVQLICHKGKENSWNHLSGTS